MKELGHTEACLSAQQPTKKKKSTDINLLAAQIVEAATGHAKEPADTDQPEKNPAAVAFGCLGGLKGGKARAQELSPRKRFEIEKNLQKLVSCL